MYKRLSSQDSYVLEIIDNKYLYLSVLDEILASADHDSEVIRLTEKELEQFINNLLDKLIELKYLNK